MLLGLLILFACGSDSATYNDFNHISHWDDLDQLEGEKTIIYYYSPFCDICINLEPSVSSSLKELEEHFEIFLIDTGEIYEQGTPDFEYRETVPALIIFENQEFQEWIIGSTPVTNYLEEQLNKINK